MSNLVNKRQVQSSFDYEVLDLETRTVVQQRTEEIRNRLRRTAQDIFINVYEAFGNPANFAEIDIAVSALYLLAAPSTSQENREQFVQRARAGEKITYKNVQKKLKEAKSQLLPLATTLVNSSESSMSRPDIVTILPKTNVEVNPLVVKGKCQISVLQSGIVNLRKADNS